MKKLAATVVVLTVMSSAAPAFAAANMSLVKTCVAKIKKDLGAFGNGSLQAAAFLEACIRSGGQ